MVKGVWLRLSLRVSSVLGLESHLEHRTGVFLSIKLNILISIDLQRFVHVLNMSFPHFILTLIMLMSCS